MIRDVFIFTWLGYFKLKIYFCTNWLNEPYKAYKKLFSTMYFFK